jgi:hypothetical protein
VVCFCRGEGQTGADILLLKIRKIAQHFGLAYTGGKKIENVLHPNTHTADARATPTLIRIEGNAIHDTEPNSHAEGSKGSERGSHRHRGGRAVAAGARRGGAPLGAPAIDRTLDGLGDKTVIFGVISMGDPEPETPDVVAARIRRALEYLPPERLIPAPDCGVKYIPRDLAFAKLKALADGAAIVRRELQRN